MEGVLKNLGSELEEGRLSLEAIGEFLFVKKCRVDVAWREAMCESRVSGKALLDANSGVRWSLE